MPDQNQPNDPTQDPTQGSTRPVLTTEEVPTTTPPSTPTTPTNVPADTPPPVVPETTDVPPPPPGPEPTDTVVSPTSDIQHPTSSFDLPPVVGAPPKKKFGGKRVISTILGLLLLIGGIGAGVVLVKQQQFFGQQAAGDQCGSECVKSGNSVADCKPAAGFKCVNGFLKKTETTAGGASFGECQGGQKRFVNCTTKLNCPGKVEEDCVGGKYVTVGNQCQDVADDCPAGKKEESSSGGGGGGGGIPKGNCSNSSAAQCQSTKKPGDICHEGRGTCIDTGKTGPEAGDPPICRCKVPETGCKEACPGSDGILRNCTPPEADGTPEESICSKTGRIESCGGKQYCCPAPGGKWTTDMTACQGSGTCLNVKAYSGDDTFTLLTTDALKALKPGDKVRFAVAGSVSAGTSGTYDKASFKINSEAEVEETHQKPGSNEFWHEYTIPDGTTSFNITAQIHHTVLGWSN